jgi:hypothetical protein
MVSSEQLIVLDMRTMFATKDHDSVLQLGSPVTKGSYSPGKILSISFDAVMKLIPMLIEH